MPGSIEYTTRTLPFGIKNNSGGLNSSASGLAVQDNESTDCQNVDFDKFGSIVKRSGYSQLNTTAFNSGAAWNSLHWFEISDGTQYLVGTCGNKIAQTNSLSQTATPFTDITGAVTVTAGNNNFVSWATYLDTAMGTNGVDAPFQWTGTGNASAMTVPTNLTTAKFIAVFKGYTFLANVVVNSVALRSRVYWSDLDSITSWTANMFRDVNKSDGQSITGIKVLGDRLIIFKNRSIWAASFTGDSDLPFVFEITKSTVGCDSPFSIQAAQNGLIFHAPDGDYYFDGDNSFKISDRVQTTLDSFGSNRFPQIVSCYQTVKNRYWSSFTVSGGTTHNRILTYDAFNNAFSIYTGIAANCYAIIYVNGEERVYFGDYAGFVYRADNGTDDYPAGVQTAIPAYYYTKWFNFDDLVNQKGIPFIEIFYEIANSTLTFAYSYDFESADTYSQTFSMNTSTSVYGTAIYGTDTYAASGGARIRRDLTGRGVVIRLKVANSNLSETFRIDGFGIPAFLEAAG